MVTSLQTMPEERRRILKTLYRILSNTGDERYKAFDRLIALVGESAATAVFLEIEKPDPTFVEQWLKYRLAWASPFRRMT